MIINSKMAASEVPPMDVRVREFTNNGTTLLHHSAGMIDCHGRLAVWAQGKTSWTSMGSGSLWIDTWELVE